MDAQRGLAVAVGKGGVERGAPLVVQGVDVRPAPREGRRLQQVPKLKGEMTAMDRTIRTFQIRVRSEFLESKENHEKHRREKNHFDEAAFDPKYKKGPHEWKEKGNKLH